jgi:hypothetical protein
MPDDLARLSCPTAHLNDVCLNGGAIVLQEYFSCSTSLCADKSKRCAILSTYDLVRIRYRAADNELWRNLRHTFFWTKDIWILPIHRTTPADHWVLGIVFIHSHQLLLFDSLSSKRRWKQDVKVSCHQPS